MKIYSVVTSTSPPGSVSSQCAVKVIASVIKVSKSNSFSPMNQPLNVYPSLDGFEGSLTAFSSSTITGFITGDPS